jgi:RimJ/RimL family protein N-acetyltransferase
MRDVAPPAATDPLTGRHVELVPLAREHTTALLAAATADRSTYGYTEVPATPEHMADYVERLLAGRDGGTDVPFAQRRRADGVLVGCTRFLELRHWRGRAEPDEVEIGGTWLAADAQRTPINTEAKLLLLTHAFETWRVWRVAVATDARNERSRRAIERLGARLEGVLRHHRPSTVTGEEGRPRDTALYAITDDDWPHVRATLLDRLAMPYGHA